MPDNNTITKNEVNVQYPRQIAKLYNNLHLIVDCMCACTDWRRPELQLFENTEHA